MKAREGMELIENLLQLLAAFLGALISGGACRKNRGQAYFLLLCFYVCFALGCALLDAVPAAVLHHAPRLLCVGFRLGGQPDLPAHIAGHSIGHRRSAASAA